VTIKKEWSDSGKIYTKTMIILKQFERQSFRVNLPELFQSQDI
jgi:hypothetical protein